MITKDTKPREWKPCDIVYLALVYATSDAGYIRLGAKHGLSKTTIGDYFNILLPQYDKRLANIVHEKAAWNKAHVHDSWTMHKFHNKSKKLKADLDAALKNFKRIYKKPKKQPEGSRAIGLLIWNVKDRNVKDM